MLAEHAIVPAAPAVEQHAVCQSGRQIRLLDRATYDRMDRDSLVDTLVHRDSMIRDLRDEVQALKKTLKRQARQALAAVSHEPSSSGNDLWLLERILKCFAARRIDSWT
jgi:hypothetical protein